MMPKNWIETAIGNQVTLQRGIDITRAEQREGSVPVISSGGISSFHDTAAVSGPGVILGRKGVVGSVYYVDGDYWPHDTTLWVKDFHNNLPRFVYYFFKHLTPVISSMDVGSANPTLNRNHVHPIRTIWPSLPEQRAIAGILGALDDKVELNRRMNRTLESMARVVFRQWFVEGEEVASWEVGKLGDIAVNIRRGVQPYEIAPETPYIGLEHMPRGSFALDEWGSAAGLESNKFRFEQGEFLFGKLRPYFQKVGVAPLAGICSTDILVIASQNPDYYGVMLGYISSSELINYTNAASTGTKMPRTNWSDIARYEIPLPPRERALEFNNLIMPIIRLIQSNIFQSHTLGNLRDTLLPKLMRGEVRVSEL